MFRLLITALFLVVVTGLSVQSAAAQCFAEAREVDTRGRLQPILVPKAADFCMAYVTPTVTHTNTTVPTATITATATTPPNTATRLPTNTYAPTGTPWSTATPNPMAVEHVVPDDFASIQAAVNAASSGDTILVRSGAEYNELVTANKPGLTIKSYDPEDIAWINGGCTRAGGVTITALDVVIEALGIHNTREYGVNLGPGRALVQDSVIQDWNCADAVSAQYAAAVRSWYGGPNHRVIGNTLTRRVSIAQGTNWQGNGIWFKSCTPTGCVASGGGHVITDNTIIGTYDGIGGEVESDGNGGVDQDTLIARNTILGCYDDGIQVEGGTQNVRVEFNDVRACGVGIAFTNNIFGPLFIENNTLEITTSGKANMACFKVGRTGQGTAYLNHNVCNTGGTGIQQTNAGLSAIEGFNNRFNVGRYLYEFTAIPTPSYMIFDNNCLYTTDITRFVKWHNNNYTTLQAYRNASGQDLNSTLGPC